MIGEQIMSTNQIEVGQAIKYYRKKLGMTQEQLAEKSNLSVKYISLIENGSSKNISIQKLSNIATALDVNLASMLATDKPQFSDNSTPYTELLFLKLQNLPLKEAEEFSKVFLDLFRSLENFNKN